MDPAVSVESAPDKPLHRDLVRAGSSGPNGQPSKLTDQVAASIVNDIIAGCYMNVAAKAAGVTYAAIREWVSRGTADAAAGLDTRYARFADLLSRADAEAEKRLQRAVEQHSDEDWRAPAFILERRWRERWGKNDQPQAQGVQLVLTAEVSAALLDALRVAAAKPVHELQAQTIDSEADGSAERSEGTPTADR